MYVMYCEGQQVTRKTFKAVYGYTDEQLNKKISDNKETGFFIEEDFKFKLHEVMGVSQQKITEEYMIKNKAELKKIYQRKMRARGKDNKESKPPAEVKSRAKGLTFVTKRTCYPKRGSYNFKYIVSGVPFSREKLLSHLKISYETLQKWNNFYSSLRYDGITVKIEIKPRKNLYNITEGNGTQHKRVGAEDLLKITGLTPYLANRVNKRASKKYKTFKIERV